MMGNSPNIDLVNIYVYTKFGQSLSFFLKIFSEIEDMTDIRTNGKTDNPKPVQPPPPFSKRGYNKEKLRFCAIELEPGLLRSNHVY